MENSFLEKYELLPQAAQQTVADLVDFLFEKYKKERLEAIVRNLGFADLLDFWTKKSLDAEMSNEKIAAEIRQYVLHEMASWQKIIQDFENKYQNDLTYLRQHFHELREFDELEKESDEVEWEAAFSFIEAHQKTLQLL